MPTLSAPPLPLQAPELAKKAPETGLFASRGNGKGVAIDASGAARGTLSPNVGDCVDES